MGDTEDRLARARMTLLAAEERAGLRTVAQRSLEVVSSPVVVGRIPGGESEGREGAVPMVRRPVQGAVLQVPSGIGDLMRAAAGACPEEGWLAFAGIRDVGWRAASEMGIDLARVIDVPEVGEMAGDVLSALLDGVDVLCVGDVRLRASQRKVLAARARRDAKTVLTVRAWPGLSAPADPGRPMRVMEAV